MIDQIFVLREGRGCGSRHFGGREGRGESHERHEHGYRGRRWGFEHRWGGGRERFFDAGDIKLVILKLLSEQPSYGYQLIKTMEERLAGGYSPSAGVIYPTLTMLEEEGLATASAESNRKVYSLTPGGAGVSPGPQGAGGRAVRAPGRSRQELERGRSPEIRKAFMNLRSAVIARVSREGMSAEQLRKIAEAINAAAKTIDEL